MAGDDRKSGGVKSFAGLTDAYAIALGFVGVVVVLALVGLAIDSWLGSSPIALLIGLGMGLFGGGWSFIRNAIRATNEASRTPPRKR